jgi:hypothetical protein
MTYHIVHTILTTPNLPTAHHSVWLDKDGVESANIGTGVKKVWKEVYGAWGRFDVCAPGGGTKAKALAAKKAFKKDQPERKRSAGKANGQAVEQADQVGNGVEGKIVKKIMMPAMPTRV